MSERSEIYQKLKERGLEKDFKWPGFDIDEAKARIKKYDLFEKEPEVETQEEPVEEEIIEESTQDDHAVDHPVCDICDGELDEYGGCEDCDAREEKEDNEVVWHFLDDDGCPCGADNDNNDLCATPKIDDVTCDECLVILENNDAEKVDEIPDCFGEEFDGNSEKCGVCDIEIAVDCETQTAKMKEDDVDDEVLFIAVKENKTVEEVIEDSEDESEEEAEEVPVQVVKIPKKKPKKKIIPKKKRYFKKPKKKSDNPYDIAKRLMK